jgi:hypothetical protein
VAVPNGAARKRREFAMVRQDCHAENCPPASFTPTSCACGFAARFTATPRDVSGYIGQYDALAPRGYRCFFCRGPAHPATGCQYSERVIACRACTVEFWRWFKGHVATRSRPGRDKRGRVQADFYAAAAKR